jgi:hypothetical protein
VLRQENDAQAKILSSSTGKTLQDAQMWLRDRVIWTAKEALANNLVTRIEDRVESIGDITSISNPSPQVIVVNTPR